MSKAIDINSLKEEYINKTFGWLTVIDVYRDPTRGRYFFKCKCKCGNEVSIQYNKVTSGHTFSCGCYKHSKEYSDKLKSIWSTKQDVIQNRSYKYSQWCKNNYDKVIEKSEKRKRTIKENPEILKLQIEHRKETLENNPSIQQSINEKLKQCWNDNKRSEFSNKKKLYYKQHSEVREKLSQALLNFYKNNPEKCSEISLRNIEWCKQHENEISEQAIKHFDYLKERRLSTINNSGPCELIKVLHPSQIDDFIKGNIKATDNILVKCSMCGKYERRIFNNVWRLSSNSFKNKCYPICNNCLCKLSSSSYENEISDCVSLFYSGKLIRNSRDIISPFELDLYYPEKKIAIEYNGSYWHDEDHKPENYHYNKFKLCNNLGISLVSIFEKEWVNLKEQILSYLRDLFNNKENSLSFINETTVNLNYPPPNLDLNVFDNLHNNSYIHKGRNVFMCGYTSKQI